MQGGKTNLIAGHIADTTAGAGDFKTGGHSGWKKLKSIFNKVSLPELAVGAAISIATKAAILSCTASFAAPAAGLAGAVAVAGAASNLGRHYFKYWRANNEDRSALSLTWKQIAGKAAMGAVSGLTGGAIGYGLAEAFQHLYPECLAQLMPHDTMIAQAPPPAAAPIMPAAEIPAAESVAVAPAPTVEMTPMQSIKDYIASHDVGDKAKDALLRASSDNPRIAAQGLDDLAVMTYNGIQGMEQAQEKALILFKQAADMGNLKARADLLDIQFHGNKTLGIKADPEAAIDKMVELSKHSKYAAKMVQAWVGPS